MFEISRRDLIVGAAGAYAAFGLDRPLAFIGAAQAQITPATPGFKSTKVGDLEVISLYDGVWEKPHDENFIRSEEHTSELQSRSDLVCRLLLEKKKKFEKARNETLANAIRKLRIRVRMWQVRHSLRFTPILMNIQFRLDRYSSVCLCIAIHFD